MSPILYWLISFAFITLIGITIWLYVKLTALQDQNRILILAQRQSKSTVVNEDTIHYKLDPHLLKNALNTIQSHAYQSYHALDKLSNVLDFILYESDLKWIKLKDEINFAQNLIEINRLKLSPLFDLHVRARIPKEAEDQLVPRFISINSIENAFKHADLQQEDSFISIIFEVIDEKFVLIVSNKIASYATSTTKMGGVGNATFLARLQSIYGDDYTLDIDQKDNIYTIKLAFQLQKYDQMYNS